MYGRMGGKTTTQKGLQIFKIDVNKNIIYVKGSIPGKPGVVVKIKDTLIPSKLVKNLDLVEYPTFI
ncbi:UNVERIFIED_CONTAM: hypothetical protein GTU68_051535 [Idotea baltica]|nr:hypothetical protein [Idotea baltica]